MLLDNRSWVEVRHVNPAVQRSIAKFRSWVLKRGS